LVTQNSQRAPRLLFQESDGSQSSCNDPARIERTDITGVPGRSTLAQKPRRFQSCRDDHPGIVEGPDTCAIFLTFAAAISTTAEYLVGGRASSSRERWSVMDPRRILHSVRPGVIRGFIFFEISTFVDKAPEPDDMVARGEANVEMKRAGISAALRTTSRRERYSVPHTLYRDGLDHIVVGVGAPHAS
jgi:hypothetical protein